MMDANRFERISELFEAARSLPEDECDRFLSEACSDDASLREEVEELLAEHSRQSPLDTSAPGELAELIASDAAANTDTPTKIDRYTIIKHIGEGGMGSVYEARQENPDRSVALKVIKRGMDSKQVIARFEAERRAVSMMDHPNIAQVFDAGTTQDGRPFFAMELVDGVSIIDYFQAHELDMASCLKMFMQVCRAIQHAHQKGIIHRDIKPSNVLVTDVDGVPVPKVIDFGIAKATSTELHAQTAITMQGQLVGTPAYMSPEQTHLGGQLVDTRTDIYSLGVLLYELLTGTTPFTDKELLSKGFAEMMRVITDDEPEKPSTRLLTLKKLGTSTNIDQSISSRSLSSMLQGDLDWIVMKCLEKDPDRRYESSSALAQDIERFINNEPVEARPPSRAYQIQKFYQRNRPQVIAGAAVMCVLILGIAGTTSGMIWAIEEREKARLAAVDELAAQVRATESAQRAASESKAAEELSEFFIIDVLSAADPSRTTDHELTVREALTNASDNIEGRFEDRPDVESRIQNALGYLFLQLGAPELAERHHMREWELAEKANGEFSIESARMMHSVVGSLSKQGRDTEAIELTHRQLRIIDTLATPEAEQLRPRAIGNLGALLVRTGRFAEATPILEDTLKIKRKQYGDRHPTTLSTISSLASVLSRAGFTDRGLLLAQEAYTGRIEVLGEGDPRSMNSLLILANTHARLEQLDEAYSLYQKGINLSETRLGRTHALTLNFRNTYAKALLDSGRLVDAEQEARAIINEMDSSESSIPQAQRLLVFSILSSSLLKQDRYREAVALSSESLTNARKTLTESSVHLTHYIGIYGSALTHSERFQEAEASLTEAWHILENSDPDSDDARSYIRKQMIELYTAWNIKDPDPDRQTELNMWKNN